MVAGIEELLRLLISKGAKVDAISNCGTPLHNAAAFGKKDSVRILLENGANVSKFLFQFGRTINYNLLVVGLTTK
jgi:ankyrin repeat protein